MPVLEAKTCNQLQLHAVVQPAVLANKQLQQKGCCYLVGVVGYLVLPLIHRMVTAWHSPM
jgi:hypothetical protein